MGVRPGGPFDGFGIPTYSDRKNPQVTPGLVTGYSGGKTVTQGAVAL